MSARIAVHPMVVAVACGLLAPEMLTELVDDQGSPEEDLDFLLDDAFEGAQSNSAAQNSGNSIDPDEIDRVEALWNAAAYA